MDITVIDDRNAAGFFGSLTTIGDVPMTSLTDMVNNVVVATQWQKIDMLRIVDHGSTKHVKGQHGKKKHIRCTLQFGDDKVNVGTFEKYRKPLQRLLEKFYDKSYLHLAHCWAGQDHELLRLFASLLDVPVYAGTGKRAQWSRTQFGDLVVCSPDGKVSSGVDFPD